MTKKSTRTRFVGILAGTAALAIAGGGTALADRDHPEDGPHHGTAANASGLKHYDGTVLSKQKSPKRFELRTEGGQERKFRVNAETQFERLSGFGALDRGLAVEVDAKRTDRGLVARQVETARGGGGGGGGADDPAGDDNGSGGGGADDPPGDDHGSGGHGADDGPNHT
jgi:hypothetical protein